jgi:phosphoglycolate phosphatase-like HAD superfamily hydrolase
MIETIILDLDGPVLDGMYRHYQCYKDIMSENCFSALGMEVYWEMKRQRMDRHKQLSLNGADAIYDLFLENWKDRIEDKKYLSFDTLQPGVYQKLADWKASGVKIILVTLRNNALNLYWQLDSLNLTPMFDHIVPVGIGGQYVGKADAARHFISYGCSDRALWIGDTEVDISAARQLGVKVCAVNCGLRTGDYLATCEPDFLFRNITEIDLFANHFC